MSAAVASLPSFQAPFASPDDDLAVRFLAGAARDQSSEARVDSRATRLVQAIRARAAGLGGVEEFLHAYSLSTKEGLALMVLAEALLRVPDTATADRLIEDKLAAGHWLESDVKSNAILVSASAWTLGVAARIDGGPQTESGQRAGRAFDLGDELLAMGEAPRLVDGIERPLAVLHAGKDGLHRVKVMLRNWVELVVVTLGATQRQPQERSARRIDNVSQFVLPLHAEVRMGTGYVHTKNEVTFSGFRKFQGESTITFDTDVDDKTGKDPIKH